MRLCIIGLKMYQYPKQSLFTFAEVIPLIKNIHVLHIENVITEPAAAKATSAALARYIAAMAVGLTVMPKQSVVNMRRSTVLLVH
jgi:hypothetical protein